MKPNQSKLVALLSIALLAASASASDARTSASAASNGRRSGTAAASATYKGDVGFARTDTRTGQINLARGVAVGVDDRGLSLSVSTALAELVNFRKSRYPAGSINRRFGMAAMRSDKPMRVKLFRVLG